VATQAIQELEALSECIRAPKDPDLKVALSRVAL